MVSLDDTPRINIDKPRYDQSTYYGRAAHFFAVTNSMNVFVSDAELDKAKRIVDDYRQGKLTTISEDNLWRAKHLYDSAFHPDTGDKMFLAGRMSCQVPMNMLILGGMFTWYKSTVGTIFWQWYNQSFNAVVNYTNRSGGTVNTSQLVTAYVGATGGALFTSLSLNKIAHKFSPMIGRMVPFTAVATANCINIPLMRSHELTSGISVFNEKDEKLGDSVPAAKQAISQVVVSRIIMATPSMVVPPIIMSFLEARWPIFRRMAVSATVQTLLCGALLSFATPMCCALFPQRSSIKVASLEPELRNRLLSSGYKADDQVFYNKGL